MAQVGPYGVCVVGTTRKVGPKASRCENQPFTPRHATYLYVILRNI